jgi:hypothetical protein
MKSYSYIALVLTFVAATLFCTPPSQAADKKAPKADGLRGKITAVDKDAKTISVAGKAVTVDETTVITDSGKPTKLEDLKLGADATVSTFVLGGKLTAVSIKTGVVAAAVPVTKKKK